MAESDHGVQNDANIATVRYSAVISLLLCLSMMLVGVSLVCAPVSSIGLVVIAPDVDNTNNNYSSSGDHQLLKLMSRLIGAVILSLSFVTLSLLSPMLFTCEEVTIASVDKSRTSLWCQGLVGLALVLLALFDERQRTSSNDSNQLHYDWLLEGSTVILVLSCIGLMCSYWPRGMFSANHHDDNQGGSESGCCGRRHRQPVDAEERNGLTEPLLEPGNDEEAQNHNQHDEEAEEGSSSRIQGTRRLIRLAAPQMSYLYLGCAVLLVRLPFSLSIPHFVSTTLGALGRADYHQARTEILLLFVLGTIDAALDFWCVFLFGYAKERIVRGVRIDTFAAILRQEVAFFDQTTSGELSSRLTSDCGEMAGDLTWFFRFSIESVVRITGIAVYMLVRSPFLGLCALAIVPVVAIVNKFYGSWLSKNASLVQSALAEANSVAQEAFACARTVVAFAAEQQEHDKYVEKIDKHYQLNVRQLFMTGIYYMAVSTFLINTCVQAALLFIGSVLIMEGRLSSEVLLAFMLYQGQLQNETMNLFNSYTSLIRSSGAGQKVFHLLDRRPPPPATGSTDVIVGDNDEDDNGDDQADDQRETNAMQEPQSVKLDGVGFVYPTRPSHQVLQGLNIHIEAGSTVALVGSSGCGKSTVVNLLQRLYDPSSGTVTIDGQDLRTMDIKRYRRRIGIVTQDPVLFSGSILSNIAYGSPHVTRRQAEDAAKMANAHSFVTSFPEGYDTQVGERGIQLSGGQKQRIAIARAIVKNPALLLLDEATSALDAESEHVVQEALDNLLKRRDDDDHRQMTTVVVAHRLGTVRNADAIAYIENGVVMEQGTHDNLMASPLGLYRKMVERAGTSGQLDC